MYQKIKLLFYNAKLSFLNLYYRLFRKKTRQYLLVDVKRIDVPFFEIAVNPTVKISDIKERKYIIVTDNSRID